jgi:hypothetical protein
VEHDLEEDVSQLLPQLWRVAVVEGAQRLVGLLQQEATEAGVRLGAVPGAAVGRAQPGDDLAQPGE